MSPKSTEYMILYKQRMAHTIGFLMLLRFASVGSTVWNRYFLYNVVVLGANYKPVRPTVRPSVRLAYLQ